QPSPQAATGGRTGGAVTNQAEGPKSKRSRSRSRTEKRLSCRFPVVSRMMTAGAEKHHHGNVTGRGTTPRGLLPLSRKAGGEGGKHPVPTGKGIWGHRPAHPPDEGRQTRGMLHFLP